MELVEQFVKLVGHVAWPALILCSVLVFHAQVREMLRAVAARVQDPDSKVAIGKDGLLIETIDTKFKAIEIDQEQTKSLALRALGIEETVKVEDEQEAYEIDQELSDAADEYLQIEHPDWSTRTRMKDDVARKMADIVITKEISRAALARQHHEGLILALASVSYALPRTGDIAHLLHVADETGRLHVKYRVVLALGRLFERGLADSIHADEVLRVLNHYKHDADNSLLRRIEATEAEIRGRLAQ